MTTAKIAVSLPAELVDGVRAAVRAGRAPSVSAYIAAALEQKVRRDEMLAVLDEILEETGGPLTEEERRAADRALKLGSSKKTRRK